MANKGAQSQCALFLFKCDAFFPSFPCGRNAGAYFSRDVVKKFYSISFEYKMNFEFLIQARLSRYLKILYTELALKEPIIPSWAQPVTPGALSPARLEPELRFHSQSHGLNECISVDQLLTSVQVSVELALSKI